MTGDPVDKGAVALEASPIGPRSALAQLAFRVGELG